MNDVSKTIKWATRSWNPVAGCLGPNNIPCSYCYAKRIAERFAGTSAFPNGFKPTWHPDRLEEPLHARKPQRVFIGSMTDMFGDFVEQGWFDTTLAIITNEKWHRYYVLTKQPQNILKKLAGWTPIAHLWIGMTVTNQSDAIESEKWMYDIQRVGWKTFVSIEPMLGWVNPVQLSWADWFIVGSMTGQGSKKHQPEPAWVLDIVKWIHTWHIPLFVKDSLSHVSTRQEWPADGFGRTSNLGET